RRLRGCLILAWRAQCLVFALTTRQLSLEKVIPFLRIFPCLEKLYYESTDLWGHKNAWRDTNLDDIGCLDLHLKKIVLTNYVGNVSHVNFAMFFLVNAKVLESMRLELWNPENNCRNWIARQSRRLQHEERASSCARVTFATRKSCSKFATIKGACDLSIADPFV
ncbi:uncharacterized protein LOC112271649, partial [Brachypodium distachyon]|uniref:uncharacterized protein LOC112271649 n=1 Tax=Brachypodium distachyon TaxID=15368 RepID=UPI000D0D60A5